MESKSKLKILVVDDSEMNRTLLRSMLREEYEIVEAEGGEEAITLLQQHAKEYSLLLLDILMPQPDGFAVLTKMNELSLIDDLPVIVVSSESAPDYLERAYELGATDYVARPFNLAVVKRRISNTISLFKNKPHATTLSATQRERAHNDEIIRSVFSYFDIAADSVHMMHIKAITTLLLKQLAAKSESYELTGDKISLIAQASALHDIGMAEIPENLVKKPGALTPDELKIVQSHALAGANLLKMLPERFDQESPLLKTAYEICRWHHERYDGKGYPDGLKGDKVPLSAQAVSLAEVYDALTEERPYRPAFTHDAAINMILDGKCGSFNPLLLVAFCEIDDNPELKRKSQSAS